MYSPIAADTGALVDQHLQLVERIAYHMLGRLPESVQAQDLIQTGVIGLLEAARQFDPNQGASFTTYAGIRIRGAMLDEIRRCNWAPRSVHRNTRRIAAAVHAVEQRQARAATGEEIAREMDVDIGTYQDMLKDIAGCRVLSFQDLVPESHDVDDVLADAAATGEPPAAFERSSTQAAVAKAIAALPERERLVLGLYYDEELNLREIGAVLEVSESRACQIHGQALARLRARLQPAANEAVSQGA